MDSPCWSPGVRWHWRPHLTTVGSVHPARPAIWGPASPSAVHRLFPPRQRHQPIDEGWRAGVPTVDDRLYALHPLRGHDMAFNQVGDQLLLLERGHAPGARSARYRLGARSNRGRCRLRCRQAATSPARLVLRTDTITCLLGTQLGKDLFLGARHDHSSFYVCLTRRVARRLWAVDRTTSGSGFHCPMTTRAWW